MGYRRFAPLMALVALGLLVVGASLFKIQILEHDIWANEAANLVRAGQIVPHSRGRILDRHGVELVRGLTTGILTPAMWWHVLYYVVMIAVGLVFTTKRLRALFLD